MQAAPAPTHRWLQQGAGWTLQLAGDWRGAAAVALSAPPPALGAGPLAVDAQALSEWDGGLAAALQDRLAPLARRGVALDLGALPQSVRTVLEIALPVPGAAAVSAPAQPRGWAVVGEWVLATAAQALTTAAFVGEVLLALLRLLRGKSGMRGTDLLRQIDQTGPLSIPIVSLTCFLVGLLLAYMGGAQLDKLGARAYIADIVTLSMVREMGALVTGVILSGRVGAAFAAQLATMKAGEEIDALRALGVDPIDHLVLPRLLALVLVAPLLVAYAALVGVIAGLPAATWVYGVPASEYLHKCVAALTWTHVWIGVFKCTLYSALVALAGCREGLHAGRDAQAVGAATTTAVVKALVWIVTAACVSTVVFQRLGL
jgi:phospholipid/cholesterol/gamma-HCH transport system permease protein